MEIKSTEYLSWQSAGPSDPAQAPQPVGNVLPAWWRQLPGNISHSREQRVEHRQILTDHGNRSARFCLGLRGAHNLGWTIPLEQQLNLISRDRPAPLRPNCDTDLQSRNPLPQQEPTQVGAYNPQHPQQESTQVGGYIEPHRPQLEPTQVGGYNPHSDVTTRKPFVHLLHLHPAMLEGSVWSQQVDGDYQWGVTLVAWPWRAVLPLGWRLLIMAHPLQWSHDWHVFTGCVDGNYARTAGAGGFWQWPYAMQDDLCYFKVETVLAYRFPRTTIPKDTCLFSAVPVWDPDYQPKAFRPHPSFPN